MIYMIVEMTTGKVYCGETEQSYSRQRVIDMWEAFNAEQLINDESGRVGAFKKNVKDGEQENVTFAAPSTLTCCVQRHHMINTVEMQKVIREMLECTEVPKALRWHISKFTRAKNSQIN